MSENKGLKPDIFYKIFQAIVFIGVPVGSYLILDWGILQIIGAIFVMTMVFSIDEKSPLWRRWTWSLLSFDVMVLAHFFIEDSILNWGLVLLSVVLIVIILFILAGMLDYKLGDGSTITFYFLALVIVIPITGVVIYKTVAAFGYL